VSVTVLYFASLRDRAGRESETAVPGGTAAELYDALRERHGFALPRAQLRVAVNGELAPWSRPLAAGDEVAFIPPVSGG
jgi:sulfur-carrier protein